MEKDFCFDLSVGKRSESQRFFVDPLQADNINVRRNIIYPDELNAWALTGGFDGLRGVYVRQTAVVLPLERPLVNHRDGLHDVVTPRTIVGDYCPEYQPVGQHLGFRLLPNLCLFAFQPDSRIISPSHLSIWA